MAIKWPSIFFKKRKGFKISCKPKQRQRQHKITVKIFEK
jgi:hypothetical protein